MNDKQRKRILRTWAIEQALKLEYPLSEFKEDKRPKAEKDLLSVMLWKPLLVARKDIILNTAYAFYAFVEDIDKGKYLSSILHEADEKAKVKK